MVWMVFGETFKSTCLVDMCMCTSYSCQLAGLRRVDNAGRAGLSKAMFWQEFESPLWRLRCSTVIRSTQQHHGFMRVSLTGPCNYTHTTLCGYCRPLTAYINRDQTLSFPFLTASFHFETNAKPSLRSWVHYLRSLLLHTVAVLQCLIGCTGRLRFRSPQCLVSQL